MRSIGSIFLSTFCLKSYVIDYIQYEMKQYIIMVLGYARQRGSMKESDDPAGFDDLLVDLEERRS